MSKKDTLMPLNLSEFNVLEQRKFIPVMNHIVEKYDNGTWAELPEAFYAEVEGTWAFSLSFLDGFPYYAHVSTRDATQIAYYPTMDHFLQDRPVTTRAGRLFRKAIPMDRDDSIVASVTNEYMKHLNPPELKWARTEDEIEYVFRNGPRSCMGGKEKEEDGECYLLSKVHPTRVYATEDIAVAYIQRDNGDIPSRSVINMKHKKYNRIYGNVSHLKAALKGEGYSKGTLEGCRVKIMKDENDLILMPYIDNCGVLVYEGDGNHFIVSESDEYYHAGEEIAGIPHETTGYLDAVHQCNKNGCDSVYKHNSDLGYIVNRGHYCQSCYAKEDIVESKQEGASILRKEATYLKYKDDWYLTNDIKCVTIDNELYLERELTHIGMYMAGNHRLTKTKYAKFDDTKGVWKVLDPYVIEIVDKIMIDSNVKVTVKRIINSVLHSGERMYGVHKKAELLPLLVEKVSDVFYYNTRATREYLRELITPLITKEQITLVWEYHCEGKKQSSLTDYTHHLYDIGLGLDNRR